MNVHLEVEFKDFVLQNRVQTAGSALTGNREGTGAYSLPHLSALWSLKLKERRAPLVLPVTSSCKSPVRFCETRMRD